MSASNFQLIASCAPGRTKRAIPPIAMRVAPLIDKRAERAQARIAFARNAELQALAQPRLIFQEEAVTSKVSPPPPLKMPHSSVPKRLSHEYTSPQRKSLSRRSHSLRPVSPRISPSPSRVSFYHTSLSPRPISPQSISPRSSRSPSHVLSGRSARHPVSLTRQHTDDLEKSPSRFEFDNEDLEVAQISREIELERARYAIQKREEEMKKTSDHSDSDDNEEDDSDDMSVDPSDLPGYYDLQCEEGGKKGFNAKDPRKHDSPIFYMSDQDEDTSSDEEEETEEFIRAFNKAKEDEQNSAHAEQFRLIKIGLFGDKKDQDEKDMTDSDSDDEDLVVTSEILVIESLPQPLDEELVYKSLREEVLSEEDQIKLDTNVQDIKSQNLKIHECNAEMSKYAFESKNKQEEVDDIMRLIQDAGETDTKVLRTKLTSASYRLEIASSYVTMAHETLLALKKQFGEYVINLIDDFMDRTSDWSHDMKACEYDCRCQLGSNIWITYGKSIVSTIQRRMIRHAIQEHYDDVDDVNQITPTSCNSHILYNVTGYFDIMKEQHEYVSKIMHQCHVAKIDMGIQELLKIRIKQFVRQTHDVEECEGRSFRNWLSANEGLMGTHLRLLQQYDGVQFDFAKKHLRIEILKKYPHAHELLE